MTSITNAKKLRQYKSEFPFIVEQIVALNSSPGMVREFKNGSPNFKRIALHRFTLLNILI